MSEVLYESPIDLSNLELKRVRLHHWGVTPSSNAPSGKIGYNSGALFHPQGLPEWSDGLIWHQIWPGHEPFVRDGFAIVRNDELQVDVFTGYLNGTALRSSGWEDATTLNLAGKATGTGTIQLGGTTRTITVSALSVAAGDITLANSKLLTGSGGVAVAIDRSSIFLNEWGRPTADLVFNGTSIQGVRDPILATEVATRGWVLGIVAGVAPKTPVRVATAAALPAYDPPTGGAATVITAAANGALTIDGTIMVAGDRVLVKNETGADQKWNGVYEVTNAGVADPGGAKYVLTRASDADTDAEVTTGDEYFVVTGDDNGGTSWALQTAEPITVGTTALTFVQTSGGGEYVNGNGLVLVGRTFHFAQSEPWAQNGVAYATGTTTMGITDAGVSDNVFTVGEDGVPVFGKVNLASDQAVDQILQVPHGGTGLATITAGALLLGAGTDDVALLADGGAFTALLGGGPTYGKIKLSADANAGPASSHIAGILPVANGGTGRTSVTARRMLFGAGASALSETNDTTTMYWLQAAGGAGLNEPKWVAVTGDLTSAAEGSLVIAANAVTFAKMQDLSQNVVIGRDTSGGGDPMELAAVANGHVLRRAAGVLGFGTLDLSGDTFSGTGVLPTSRGGTGLNAALIFEPHGGQVPHFRKIQISAGASSYSVPHGYGNRRIMATLIRSDGRAVGVSTTITDTHVNLTFGFVTTSDYYLMLCGHTLADTWSIP